jgi:hypothetical protein
MQAPGAVLDEDQRVQALEPDGVGDAKNQRR